MKFHGLLCDRCVWIESLETAGQTKQIGINE